MWPIRKAPKGPDAWDEAAERLIEQGLHPEKVARAKRLVKQIVKQGGLPEFDPTGAARSNSLIDLDRG